MTKPIWYYERGVLRVLIGNLEVICPDIGLPLARMVALTLQHCKESKLL